MSFFASDVLQLLSYQKLHEVCPVCLDEIIVLLENNENLVLELSMVRMFCVFVK